MGRAATLSLRLPLPRDRRLRSLCDALLEDPASSLTVEDWALRVGASPRTLARLFRGELGMSFGQWRQQMRLAQAAALVAQGRPLAAVAGELGYASPSAFSAMFKRAFGVSPSRFFHGREPASARPRPSAAPLS
jgi:AraC-like DNA-binding protein